MRFGVVHRFMTNALAALGVLALVSSGQFTRTVDIIVIVGLVLALAVRESWQRLAFFKHVDTIALVLVIALQVTRFLLGASSLDVLIEFAAALPIDIPPRDPARSAVHDQQVIVLALLHLIAGTVLGGGLGYGLCFAGVLVVAPGALVLSHLRREVEGNYRQGARDRTGLPVDVPRILRSRRVVGRSFIVVTCLLSIPIFVFTAVLFVAFPRVGLSLLQLNQGKSSRYIGFNDQMELAGTGLLKDDPTPALRVIVPNLPDPPPTWMAMHLRGRSFDTYDGRGNWSESDQSVRPIVEAFGTIPLDPQEDRLATTTPWTIELESFDPPYLFFPEDTTAFSLRKPDALLATNKVTPLRGAEGEFRYQPSDHGVEYIVYVDGARRPSFRSLLGDREREAYLHLPALPERMRALAREWTRGATTPREQATAIQHHLLNEYKYDLNTPSGKADDPLDDFLFESKRGHCSFYSSAMAVLLRVVGVPTRTVNGFAGGNYNRFGKFYVVHQGDAHSWTEAYIEDEGWVVFDPTPAAGQESQGDMHGIWATLRDLVEATSERWDRHVVNYDLDQQYQIFKNVSRKDRGGVRGQGAPAGRILFAAALGVGVVLLALFLYSRRSRGKTRGKAPESAHRHSEIVATALYESLEQAMGLQGIHRAPGTPPLRHAEALTEASHPLAPQVMTVTRDYLRARFGGVDLDDARVGEPQRARERSENGEHERARARRFDEEARPQFAQERSRGSRAALRMIARQAGRLQLLENCVELPEDLFLRGERFGVGWRKRRRARHRRLRPGRIEDLRRDRRPERLERGRDELSLLRLREDVGVADREARRHEDGSACRRSC